ncbi:transmembrane protein 41B-like [Ornithodoros turicata]
MAAEYGSGVKSDATAQPSTNVQQSTSRAFLILVMIFVVSLLCLFLVYLNFPHLEPSEKKHMKLPRDIEDAKGLGQVLNRYTDKYFLTVTSGFFVTYIFLQSFAIPGSIFLSILSGFLFPFPMALFLVCLCSSMGASFCYFFSYLVGRRLVLKYFPTRALQWSEQVGQHRDHLLNYMIFLRITPFLPNWFINITAPVIDVPITPFFVGTFLGVAPPSFVAIQAGTTLQKLSSSGDAVSWWSVSLLAAFAVLSLLPVIFKGKLKRKVL